MHSHRPSHDIAQSRAAFRQSLVEGKVPAALIRQYDAHTRYLMSLAATVIVALQGVVADKSAENAALKADNEKLKANALDSADLAAIQSAENDPLVQAKLNPTPASPTPTPTATPTLSVADATVAAATTAPATLSFPVTLSAAATTDVTVSYATTDGTALAGTDYAAVTAGSLTIPAGQTTGNVTVNVPATPTPATAAKTLTLTLSGPTGATLGTPATATGTITPAAA